MSSIGRIPGRIPRSDCIFPWPLSASLTDGSAAWRGIAMAFGPFGPVPAASLALVVKARRPAAWLPIWKGLLKRCAIVL